MCRIENTMGNALIARLKKCVLGSAAARGEVDANVNSANRLVDKAAIGGAGLFVTLGGFTTTTKAYESRRTTDISSAVNLWI
jgi:hypothetical protein